MRTVLALFAALTCCYGGDWLSVGGDAQGSNWQKRGKYITAANAKDMKLLWKRQLDNALSSPVIMGPTITHRGVRELVFVTDAHDNLYAVDADLGTLFWKRHFDADSKKPCATAAASTPVIEPDPNPRHQEDDEPGKMRPLYAVASDGRLHTVRVSDGADMNPPVSFLPPNANYSSLNFWSGTVYAATLGGCNGAPDGIWSIDVKKPGASVKVSSVTGTSVVISPTGKVSATTDKGTATWQDPDGVRWIYSITNQNVRAFKDAGPEPAWISADMANLGSPVVSNGVVFALSGIGLVALDADTGRQLYSSGPIASADHPSLAVANGHICFAAAYTLYCFGLPMER